jgi:hypothetical protein
VLLSFEDYRKLAGAGKSLFEVVALGDEDDIDFDPPQMGEQIFRRVDLG